MFTGWVPWFWALEWNKSLRLVGWIGDPEASPDVFADLPDLGWHVTSHEGGGFTRFRREVPLGEGDDLLFSADDDQAEADTVPVT